MNSSNKNTSSNIEIDVIEPRNQSAKRGASRISAPSINVLSPAARG